jgi:hypothetical protein
MAVKRAADTFVWSGLTIIILSRFYGAYLMHCTVHSVSTTNTLGMHGGQNMHGSENTRDRQEIMTPRTCMAAPRT